MRSMFIRLLFAFQMMSAIPIRIQLPVDESDMAGSMAFFPIVGAAVGGIAALGGWLALLWSGNALLAAVIVVLCYVLATGGMHIDGLCDACDGLLSHRDRERVLEIMHDSRMGTFGGLGMALYLLLSAASICALIARDGAAGLRWVVAAPIAARMSVVLLEKIGVSARKGMGSAYVQGMNWWLVGVGWLLGCALLVPMLGYWASVPVLIAAVCAPALNLYFEHRVGGLTGDLLGAENEICLLVVLVIATGLGM